MWPINPAQFKKIFPNSKINAPIEGISTDSRKVQSHEMFIALKGEKFDGHDFVVEILNNGAACALVSESWAWQSPKEIRERLIEAKDTLTSFRDFAKNFRQSFDFPVFAIGGSNGKTTTKEMLHAMLSGRNAKVTKTDKSENGFIGIAKTLTMKEHNRNQKIAALVLEIGIDEKDAMAQHVELSAPDCVLLTALGPEHLEGLGTHEMAIAEELLLFKKCSGKPRIWQLSEPELAKHFDLLEPQDCLVIDSDEFPREIESLGKSKISHFNRLYWRMESQSPEKSNVYAQWVEGAKEPISLRFDVPLPGKHNAQNFALALATALRMGWSVKEIESGWQNFKQPPMRSRIIELSKGITLYDDCYNASPLSVNAALTALEKGCLLYTSPSPRDRQKSRMPSSA